MFRFPVTPAAADRLGWTALGLVVGLFSASMAYGQAQPAAQPAPTTRVFGSDAGRVRNFNRAEKPADFEAVVGKLKEALQKREKPERKQQAMSWKVFKSPDPAAGGNALSVFIIAPAVKGADYTVSNILAEAF